MRAGAVRAARMAQVAAGTAGMGYSQPPQMMTPAAQAAALERMQRAQQLLGAERVIL